ncbi:MAG: tetratricopeptide repeat protein [Candidatus Cloacimonetes bacterium]|nr:tetratricopeptide repeat protein [Candidatus Cloacimonadota bacterium]MCF7814386.1 tetratricopeptide repeat protein [Candidatus Cloacimonadota bacterium]MCF7868534.1 tetratricopeptide repeat protein [Candidatus Cloacimonadota bacterium]MCF7884046.1 tetratricopeptide repeat protein [Candidatus Cloacimonadota bacterium]
MKLSIEYTETDTAKALQLGKQILEESIRNNLDASKARNNLAYIHYIRSEYKKALKILLENEKKLEQNEADETLAELYKYSGFIYTEQKKYQKAIDYYKKSLKIYQNLNMPWQISTIYSSLGKVYELQQKNAEALAYYQKSLSIDTELNNLQDMAVLSYIIGNNYEFLAEYVKALKSYFKALNYYQALEDSSGIADSYNTIGNIFHAINDFDSALDYYEKHLHLQQALNNKEGLAISYNNIGIIYDDTKKYEKALEYYLKALKMDEERGDEEGISTVSNNIGLAYLELEKFDLALQFLNRSLKISNQINDTWAIANTNNNLAAVYLELKNYPLAFSYVDKGYEIAKTISAKDLELEALDIYSKLYRATGNYKKSLEFYIEHSKLEQALFTTSIRKIADIQKTNEAQEQERQTEILRKNNQIKDLLLERQRNLKYFLISLIILVVLFLVVLYNRYALKKRENKIILEKNEMITKQKIQLDEALKELQILHSDLQRKMDEIKIGRERLQLLNKTLRHDLANDLVVVRSAIRIYRRNPDDAFLEEINSRVLKCLGTIKRLRDQESFMNSHSDLIEMNLKKVLQKTRKDHPEVNFEIEGDGFVFADEGLYSVFENLTANSLKHGKAKNIIVKICEEDRFIKVNFFNDGDRIAEDIIERIFEEGFHFGETGNTGIGLHIVKQTIENYDGFVDVENEDNGVNFILKLRKAIQTEL